MQILFALLLGFVVNRVRSVQRQQVILRSIKDGEREMLSYSGGPIKSPWLWEPICKLVDVEPLQVMGVSIAYRPLTTADAQLLRELPFLQELSLTLGVEEPATMEVVARLPLTRIRLHDAENKHLSDEKVRPLRHCRTLQWIDLYSVNVTNVGVRELAALPNVERMYIHYAKMDINGLEPWIAANRVHDLHLPIRMKGSDCEKLAKLTSLGRLRVYDLDEAGARHLVLMPNLWRIQVKEDPRPHVVWKAIEGLPTRVQVANRLGIEL